MEYNVARKLSVLSVAEDNYHSDRFSAKQTNSCRGEQKIMHISIDTNKTLTIKVDENAYQGTSIKFESIDLDGLIQYLQEVKTYLSEEEIISTLIGKK